MEDTKPKTMTYGMPGAYKVCDSGDLERLSWQGYVPIERFMERGKTGRIVDVQSPYGGTQQQDEIDERAQFVVAQDSTSAIGILNDKKNRAISAALIAERQLADAKSELEKVVAANAKLVRDVESQDKLLAEAAQRDIAHRSQTAKMETDLGAQRAKLARITEALGTERFQKLIEGVE